MEEEQILFEPKLDEHFSKSKLWLFSKNVATEYVNYNNIGNKNMLFDNYNNFINFKLKEILHKNQFRQLKIIKRGIGVVTHIVNQI